MFTIELKVNGTVVRKYTVKKIKGGRGGLCEYKLGDGTIIKHNYDDGAEVLAVKVLNHYINHHIEDIYVGGLRFSITGSDNEQHNTAPREVKE